MEDQDDGEWSTLILSHTSPNPPLQTKLLDADAAPKVDIAGKSPAKAIMQRAGLGPPSTEDLYQDQRAREVGTPPRSAHWVVLASRVPGPPPQAIKGQP